MKWGVTSELLARCKHRLIGSSYDTKAHKQDGLDQGQDNGDRVMVCTVKRMREEEREREVGREAGETRSTERGSGRGENTNLEQVRERGRKRERIWAGPQEGLL